MLGCGVSCRHHSNIASLEWSNFDSDAHYLSIASTVFASAGIQTNRCGHLLLARGVIKIICGGDKALGSGVGGLQTERAVVHLMCTVPTVLKTLDRTSCDLMIGKK